MKGAGRNASGPFPAAQPSAPQLQRAAYPSNRSERVPCREHDHNGLEQDPQIE